MKNVIIIHGTKGNPEKHWFPWLKAELMRGGYRVDMPRFPTPDGQSLDAWLSVIDEYKDQINEETIIIGHSIACAFILSVLERMRKPVKGVILVAGFLHDIGIPEYDVLNKTFVQKSFDWDRIKKTCANFSVFVSDNDPYVPQHMGEELAANLGVTPIIVPGAGHFNTDFGYTEFPLLLQKIQKLK